MLYIYFVFFPCLGWNTFLGPGFIGCLHQCRGIFQNPLQVAVSIQTCFLGRFNHTVKDYVALGTAGCIAKQKILPSHHKELYAALGAIVGEFQKIAYRYRATASEDNESPCPGLIWCGLRFQHICPYQQSLQNKFFPLQIISV